MTLTPQTAKYYRLIEEVLLTVFAGLCARWMYPFELQNILRGLGILALVPCATWFAFAPRPIRAMRWTWRILLFLAVL